MRPTAHEFTKLRGTRWTVPVQLDDFAHICQSSDFVNCYSQRHVTFNTRTRLLVPDSVIYYLYFRYFIQFALIAHRGQIYLAI